MCVVRVRVCACRSFPSHSYCTTFQAVVLCSIAQEMYVCVYVYVYVYVCVCVRVRVRVRVRVCVCVCVRQGR